MRNRWTLEEENTVTDEAVRICRHDTINTIGDALYMAQALIAENRRKEFFTPHYRRALIGRVEEKITKQLQRGQAKEYPKTMGPAPAQESQPPATPPAPAKPDLLQMFCAELVGQLAEHLTPKLVEEVTKSVKAELASATGSIRISGLATTAAVSTEKNGHDNVGTLAQQPKPEASKLPAKFETHKVCVIGYPDKFEQELKRKFKHLDFRFVASTTPTEQAKRVASNCERTYVMVKGGGERLAKSLGALPFSRINGSMSDLVRNLTAKFPVNTSMEPANA